MELVGTNKPYGEVPVPTQECQHTGLLTASWRSAGGCSEAWHFIARESKAWEGRSLAASHPQRRWRSLESTQMLPHSMAVTKNVEAFSVADSWLAGKQFLQFGGFWGAAIETEEARLSRDFHSIFISSLPGTFSLPLPPPSKHTAPVAVI